MCKYIKFYVPFFLKKLMEEHYRTLELSRGATKDEVRRAYFRLSLRYHPDRNRDTEAPGRFRKIHEAYRTLMDAPPPSASSSASSATAHEFFHSLFPSFRKEWLDSIPEEWLETTDVSRLEEFTSHPQVKLVISVLNSVGRCFPPATDAVPGTGATTTTKKSPVIIQQLEVDLEDIYDKKIVKVDILRLRPLSSASTRSTELLVPLYFPESIHKGEGDQISEHHSPGDVVFHVHSKPHPVFHHRREEFFHLSLNLVITPIEAYVGGRITVRHLSGRDINIRINPLFFQRMRRTFILEGFGLWDATTEVYADLTISFTVEFKELDDVKMRLLTEAFRPPPLEEEEDWVTLQV